MTSQIRALKNEAIEAGDLRMEMICRLALEGQRALDGAEDGTEADALRQEGWTQDDAVAECERVIAAGQG